MNNCSNCEDSYILSNYSKIYLCFLPAVAQLSLTTTIQDIGSYVTIHLTYNYDLSDIEESELSKAIKITIPDYEISNYETSFIYIPGRQINITITPSVTLNEAKVNIQILSGYLVDIRTVNVSNQTLEGDLGSILVLPSLFIKVMEALSANIQSIITSYIITFLPALIFSGSLSVIFDLLDCFQEEYFYIFINMNIPLNYKLTLELFSFSFSYMPDLSTPILWKSLLNDKYKQLVLSPPEKFNDQGYSALFLKQGLSLDMILILALIFILFFYGVILKFDRLKRRSIIQYLEAKKLKWNLIIRYMMASLNQLLAASLLQITTFDNSNWIFIISYCFGILNYITCIGFIIWLIWIIKYEYEKEMKKNRRSFLIKFDKYSTFFEDFRNKKITMHRCFNIFIISKKFLSMNSIVLLYNYPACNLIFLCMLDLILAINVLKYKPYIEKRANKIYFMQQSIFFVIKGVLLYCLAEDFDEFESVKRGWGLVALNVILVCVKFSDSIMTAIEGWKKIIKFIEKKLEDFIKKRRVVHPAHLKSIDYYLTAPQLITIINERN